MSGKKLKRAGVMMTGVTAAALTATGGAELASAATAAQPATTGTIYACYSNKTSELFHSTKAKCLTGQTLVSWNAKGPQGEPRERKEPGAPREQPAPRGQPDRPGHGEPPDLRDPPGPRDPPDRRDRPVRAPTTPTRTATLSCRKASGRLSVPRFSPR
jgi:hypothetical protein